MGLDSTHPGSPVLEATYVSIMEGRRALRHRAPGLSLFTIMPSDGNAADFPDLPADAQHNLMWSQVLEATATDVVRI